MGIQTKRLSLVIAGVVMFAMAGCGGGSGSGSAASATPSLSITGTAATGASISGGPVSVKCASGTGSGTTNADGSYSVTVTNGTFPCLAKVTAADGTVLNSVVAGTGGTSAVANITPVTQLIVASLAGGDPAAYFAAFDATAAGAVTTAKVAAAQTEVVAQLKSAGVDFSALGDLITGTLKPASSGIAGNAYDLALDALKSALTTSGLTLADLTSNVVAVSPNVPPAVAGGAAIDPAGVPSLPADLLLKAKASTCAALRSTTYRIVVPKAATALANQLDSATINAATLTGTNGDGSTFTLVPVANSPCRFTSNGGKDELVVSQAGIIVARANDSGATYRPAFGLPVQTHTLAELAGTWNTLGTQTTGVAGVYTAAANTATLDNAGTITGQSLGCFNNTTWNMSGADCSLQTPSSKFAANADGGFDVLNAATGALNGRMFAFRAGGGELMALVVGNAGNFTLFTKQRTLSLPAVGRVTTHVGPAIGQALTIDGAFGAGNQQTILSQDAVAGSFVRTAKTIGGTNDRPETLTQNSPRNGYSLRTAASAVPAIDNTTVNVLEFTALSLRGMGMTPVVFPAAKILVLSVDLP